MGSQPSSERTPVAMKTRDAEGAAEVAGLLREKLEPLGMLNFHLIRGEAMPDVDWWGESDPYVLVDAAGSTVEGVDLSLRFGAKKDTTNPSWDEDGVVLFDPAAADGKFFSVKCLDEGSDKVLLSQECELPAAGGAWEDRVIEGVDGAKLFFRVRLAAAAAPSALPAPDEERVLELEGGLKAVLLRYSPPNKTPTKAWVWLPGRNDTFRHPKLAAFLHERGYDIWALSFRNMGHCKRLGFMQDGNDPYLNSHPGPAGDFGVYHEEIGACLVAVKAAAQYERTVCYAHSTGGLQLCSYLEAGGAQLFDCVVLNGPFLGWRADGSVAGVPKETLLEILPKLMLDDGLGVWESKTAAPGQDGGGLSAEYVKHFKLTPWDLSSAPIHGVRVTMGFIRGSKRVMEKLQNRREAGLPLTTRPLLVLSGRGDAVLHSDETLRRADIISPNRTEIQLPDTAGHDVFKSFDPDARAAARGFLGTWLDSVAM